MPTDREFDQAVSYIGECVENIGDDIHAEAYSEADDRHVGYQCVHGPYVYEVLSDPSSEYFTISFDFDIISDFKGVIDESDAEEIVGGSEGGSRDVAALAAIEILESMPPESKSSLAYHLTQQLTNTDVAFNLHQTQSGATVGFQITRKVFPYDDGLSLSEFNHSVQTVVSCGHGALRFLSHSFDLESILENGLEGDVEEPGNLRYIQ